MIQNGTIFSDVNFVNIEDHAKVIVDYDRTEIVSERTHYFWRNYLAAIRKTVGLNEILTQ